MIDMMVRMGKISRKIKKARTELRSIQLRIWVLQRRTKDKKLPSGAGGLGNILPTKGQQLAAPV